MTMLRQPATRLRRGLKMLRSGLWLGAGQYGGNYRRMNRLYMLEDPWKLSSARERERFQLTNRLIAQVAPNCDRLLEIGSGEGLQTAYLRAVARQVTGIEVSEVAAERARAALPEADFLVGRAEDAAQIVGKRRFDIVTACEILYYAPDVPQILKVLQGLAPRILVTNYEKRGRMLAHHFDAPGWTRLDDMVVQSTRWRCHLWCAPADPRGKR